MAVIRGLVAYPITPADADGVVDAGQLRRLIRRLVDAGVDRIGLLGSTGTYAYLSRAERRRAIEAAAQETAGKVPMMAGIGALRTDEAAALAHDALEAGADAGLLAPVSYTPLTEAEVFAHFQRVAGEGLPICIYNNPSTTHFSCGDELVQRLSAVPGVIGVKNPAPAAAEAAARVEGLREKVPAGFSLGYSVDAGAAEALIAGGDAWHSVLGGLFPGAALDVCRAAMGGDAVLARRLTERLAGLWALVSELGGLRVTYAAANAMGLVRAAPPRPILPLDLADETRLLRVLADCGLEL